MRRHLRLFGVLINLVSGRRGVPGRVLDAPLYRRSTPSARPRSAFGSSSPTPIRSAAGSLDEVIVLFGTFHTVGGRHPQPVRPQLPAHRRGGARGDARLRPDQAGEQPVPCELSAHLLAGGIECLLGLSRRRLRRQPPATLFGGVHCLRLSLRSRLWPGDPVLLLARDRHFCLLVCPDRKRDADLLGALRRGPLPSRHLPGLAARSSSPTSCRSQ